MKAGKLLGIMMVGLFATMMFAPEIALAQTTPPSTSTTNTGLLGLTTNLKAQAKGAGDLAVYVAFFIATILVVIAGWKLKQHSEDERAGHLKSFGWYMISGIILATAGAVLGIGIGTFYGTTDSVTTKTTSAPHAVVVEYWA